MPTGIRYDISVVGTKYTEAFTSKDQWLHYLGKVWAALGPEAVRNIQSEIGQKKFKNSIGRLQRSVTWESSDWSMIVYMDPAIAPHAIYQEKGVHRHEMRYLLTATRPIPIPTGETYKTDPGGKYPRTVFRWATEKWMGVPHPFEDHRGRTRMATGWVHPGYEGKYFFRDGIKHTLEVASERIKGLVFMMKEDTGEGEA